MGSVVLSGQFHMDLVPCLPQLIMENEFIPCLLSRGTSLHGKGEGSSVSSQVFAGHKSCQGEQEVGCSHMEGHPGIQRDVWGARVPPCSPREPGGAPCWRLPVPALPSVAHPLARRRRGACKRLCCLNGPSWRSGSGGKSCLVRVSELSCDF